MCVSIRQVVSQNVRLKLKDELTVSDAIKCIAGIKQNDVNQRDIMNLRCKVMNGNEQPGKL